MTTPPPMGPSAGPVPPQSAAPPGPQGDRVGAPLHGQPHYSAPGPGNKLVTLALAGLLIVFLLQAIAVFKLGSDVSRQRERERMMAEQLTELERTAKAFDEQILQIEGRVSGILNAAEIADEVLPSVFQVEAGGSTGTAFVMADESDDGGALLVTNYHVVQGVDEAGERSVTIQRDGRDYRAVIAGTDKALDVAVLRAQRDFPRLSAATGTVNAGEPVVVVGAPLGLSDTVTTGVVSAVRELDAGGGTVIQFDAAISPGNSGGPVVNAEGAVVGVATAKIVEHNADGIGFAISITDACTTKPLEC